MRITCIINKQEPVERTKKKTQTEKNITNVTDIKNTQYYTNEKYTNTQQEFKELASCERQWLLVVTILLLIIST